DQGSGPARWALALVEDSQRFLSTVQIGITLIGILTGAVGGARLSGVLAQAIAQVEWLAPASEALGVGIIVVLTTFLSLVLGELVPKRVALNSPERVAMVVSPLMSAAHKLVSPFARVLNASSDLTLRILRVGPSAEPPVTEEEVKDLIQQGTDVGVFEPSEQQMVERVFRLDDRVVGALMTPKPEVDWLDLDDTPEEILDTLTTSEAAVFPVAEDGVDNIVGLVRATDLLSQALAGKPLDLRAALRPALFVPDNITALELLEDYRDTHDDIALVIDEYGSFQGVVTMEDVLEAIVGDLPTAAEAAAPEAVQREDGSWLMDGSLAIDEFKELLHLERLPDDEEGRYQTLGGFVMALLGRVPEAGNYFEWGGMRFEVIDMDSLRVDKVLVSPVIPAELVEVEPPLD
ncbi:MAG: HlyC/CorC family transporter, partial [Chloroflexi bacterium]|nr:HlyC/CorC family transporter [Chloroflexota bacterium]